MALCAALPLRAESGLEMIVDRGDGHVSVFLSMPAPAAVDLFGLPPAALVGADGTVPFDALRLGTFDIGDTLWTDVRATIDGVPATFEAMSLMVHPKDSRAPFDTPLDGIIAIGVCTVPDPNAPCG